ncbi:MAG: glycosyltransferase [Cytophagales bacterium]
MIFITTGTQAPFDRLIKALDEIAPQLGGQEIIAQVAGSDYKPQHIKTYDFMAPADFSKYFKNADFVIAHAGMGTIISALVDEKPLIIIPRLTKYKEHRSDHQLATANKIKELNYVHVVLNEEELKNKVLEMCNGNTNRLLHKLGNYASESLILSLKEDIGL